MPKSLTISVVLLADETRERAAETGYLPLRNDRGSEQRVLISKHLPSRARQEA